VVLAPLFVVIAAAVKLTSRGPVFYRGVRAGKDGLAFRLVKFRSMYTDRDGSGITRADDDRITPVGKVLRKLKLDEFPQLINVLKGEMTLVGPRPEDPRFVEFYPEELKRILALKPGITSAASLRFRDESSLLATGDHEKEYVERILPEKLRVDLEYFDRAGFWDHVRLILRTVLGKGKI